VHPYQGFFGDDTGLNGVRLLCDTGTDTVTSSVGPYGDWKAPVWCPRGERLVSFRLRVEASRGLWDDTAATDMAVRCSWGKVLDGQGLYRGNWGYWSDVCDPACGVCGIRSRVD
ncbi:VMO1 protein, partial [Promerops cafer]|nr:VMO1 protein [Promerops cafer]